MQIKSIAIFISQLFVLWLLNKIGSIIVSWLYLPIPGNVLGMILLFTLLLTGVIKLEWIDRASSFLLKHLVFFFIPITVGIMTLGTVFLQSGLSILFILVASAVLGIIVTGRISQIVARKREVVKK